MASGSLLTCRHSDRSLLHLVLYLSQPSDGAVLLGIILFGVRRIHRKRPARLPLQD